MLCKILDSFSRQMVDRSSWSGKGGPYQRDLPPHEVMAYNHEATIRVSPVCELLCLFHCPFLRLGKSLCMLYPLWLFNWHSGMTMLETAAIYSKESHATFELTALSFIYLSSHLCVLWTAWLVSTTALASTRPHVQSVMCVVYCRVC